MISLRRALIATSFTTSLVCICVGTAYAEAPVVDESENFALFDKQAAREPSAAQNIESSNHFNDTETAFAHEEADRDTGNNLTLLNKLQGLQQDIQELRGQLEVQAHDLKVLQQQQVDFYKDLDARLRHEAMPTNTSQPQSSSLNLDDMQLKTSEAQPDKTPSTDITPQTAPSLTNHASPSSITPSTLPASTPKQAASTTEQAAYLNAYELINNKQFDEALPAMQTFAATYPQSGYIANAHYWIGELFMVKKDYHEAIEHFELVLQHYPSSSKSSASMLKIGYALAAAGEINQAKQRLQSVIKQYPDTHAAQLAMAKLESIGNR